MTPWTITRDPQWPDQMSFYFLWSLGLFSLQVTDYPLFSLMNLNSIHRLISSQQKCKRTPSTFPKLFPLVLLCLELCCAVSACSSMVSVSSTLQDLEDLLGLPLPVPKIQKRNQAENGSSCANLVSFLSRFPVSSVHCTVTENNRCLYLVQLSFYLTKATLVSVFTSGLKAEVCPFSVSDNQIISSTH